MVIRSHSPLPEFASDGGPSRRAPRALTALAAVLLATVAGLSGDSAVRSGAPLAPPPAASAAPSAAPASPDPAAAARPEPEIALDVDAAGRTAEENQLVGMMNAEVADKVRADETLLPLVTWRIAMEDPPKPTPTSETAIVDGVALGFPVETFPDNKDSAQHWGFVVRAPRRAAHHRVSFADTDKVYEWTGVRWIQTKGYGAEARRERTRTK